MISVMVKTNKVTEVPAFTMTCFGIVTNKILSVANTIVVTSGNTIGVSIGNTVSVTIK